MVLVFSLDDIIYHIDCFMSVETALYPREKSHLVLVNNLLNVLLDPGQPQWRSGLAPPAAQDVMLETWDRVPHRAPCMEPASSVSASLSLSL